MRIELQRAVVPQDMRAMDCVLCEVRFDPPAVQSLVFFPDNEAIGYACRECALHLGERNPERFPMSEEYEEADRRYPSPTFTSEEEYGAAVMNDPYAEYRASLVSLA